MEAIYGQAGQRRFICALAAMALGLAAFAATAAAATAPSTTGAAASPRERLSLDRGWLFHLGDITPPDIKGADPSYNNAKAGNAAGAAATTYDDSDWRALDLPHDWAVEGPFDPNGNSAQGYRPRGVGWYRRYLRIDPSERGRHMELQFDAIATHATVWVNGNLVHRNWSAYNASNIDITPYLRYGDAGNTIAIRADANPMEGWWYEGAGIYRHAWLVKSNGVHVVTDGVAATARLVKGHDWSLPVGVTLNNSADRPAKVSVEVSLFAPDGKLAASAARRVALPVLANTTVTLPLAIKAPARWSLEQRNLYRVSVTVRQDGKLLDETMLHTGFRTIRFDPQQGLFLNEQHVKLQGVCIHQDHAGVGVAVPDAIWEYRLRRLKELGVNAIRFSHNAVAPEVMDMVDRMGFLVMDENRNFNPSPDYLLQLEWMVRRDRHRPGVILWSVFNEEPEQGTEVGYEMVRRMVAAVKTLDATRPVTAAMNGGYFSERNVAQAVDVVGANYHVGDYDKYHKANPGKPFTSSEDTSAFMTRGEFSTDAGKNLIASYDDDFAQWGNSHRDAWQAIATRPFVAGSFVWTGFDYRGEPTPNVWPSVSSVFGIMDMNGFPKTAYYLHQVQWIKDRPLIYLAPHWNWAGKEGKDIRVMVMANVERAMLLLNGRVIGEQAIDPYRMNYFTVPYQSGKLEAVGFNHGREVARASVETTGPAVALEMVPDRDALAGDGRDAMPITVRAIDAQGRAVPTDSAQLTFDVSGAGRAIGHGNGDPNSHEDEQGSTRKLFNGLAQLIVQSSFESAGMLQVTASAPGLRAASVRIPVKAVGAMPFAPAAGAAPTKLGNWRIAPASATRPDPASNPSESELQVWGWGQQAPAKLDAEKGGQFNLFRTSFTPRKNLSDGNAHLRFKRIAGKAEVWLDGRLAGTKSAFAPAEWRVPLLAGTGARRITVIIERQAGEAAGMDDVSVEAGSIAQASALAR
ncbi:beta-galactosidase GalA [Massilia sp. TSP1-1-2]|uniref:beta-galactosidase GalA n=1 Tax=Massilia sp. TSP1-1-2 TaxID=2804649 RepID=UPI003CE87771